MPNRAIAYTQKCINNLSENIVKVYSLTYLAMV